MSFLSTVQLAPKDAIFGLNEKFAADPRTDKINLSVGVYRDENGHLPLLRCVQEAEKQLATHPAPRGYLPMDGLARYDELVRELVFGPGSAPVVERRVATVQSLGGTGALKVGADFLRAMTLADRVLISDPTWANHINLFARAGYQVSRYRYHTEQGGHAVDFQGLLADLGAAAAGTVVVLHACCHNPTGYDLKPEQWDQVIAIVRERRLIAFLDMAYQGFGNGLADDNVAVRKFAEAGLQFLVSNSFSKNFSLYGERVGALSVVCADADEAERVLSQLKIMVRTNYSNPPTHGAAVVSTILSDARLRTLWEEELAAMRSRIKRMRQQLVDGLRAAGVQQELDFMIEQLGMFSYSGLSRAQMEQLRTEHGVYGLDSGRLCVAGLNAGNMDAACAAIARVMMAEAVAA